MHIAKAGEENLEMLKADLEVDEYDDHALHINEHTRYLLSAEFKRRKDKAELKKRYAAHIAVHKEKGKQ